MVSAVWASADLTQTLISKNIIQFKTTYNSLPVTDSC